MAIRTKESLAGFVATDPELTFTSNGDARVRAARSSPRHPERWHRPTAGASVRGMAHGPG